MQGLIPAFSRIKQGLTPDLLIADFLRIGKIISAAITAFIVIATDNLCDLAMII